MKTPLRFLRLAVTAAVGLTLLAAGRSSADAPVPLAGQWRFALDPQDQGVTQQWFHRDLSQTIALPGVLQTQGYGDPISTDTPWMLSLYDHFWYLRAEYKADTQAGNVRVPFLSQPPRHYTGTAWYQRDVTIPAGWQGRRVVLTLERPHWESTVWLDDRPIGSNNSLCAPHVYDLGLAAPGRHRLSVRVDNHLLLPYRLDAHSVSDSEGGAWNGMVGDISLSDTTPVWIDDAQVYPDVATKTAAVKVRVGNATGQAGSGTLSVGGVSVPVAWDAGGGTAQITVPLGAGAQTWDEFHPTLQHLSLQLSGGGADDRRDLSFGLRQITTQGAQFLLNGRPLLLRMTHDGGDFPLTGAPATDVASWKRIIGICKSYGLNGMRFHSWCPPDAAFTAADELGFCLQPECGMWNSISPGSANEKMLYTETERILKAYGNHPSFLLLSPSNEPSGAYMVSLPKWVSQYKAQDTRRLFTEKTGWDVSLANDTSQYLVQPHIDNNQLRGDRAWFGGDWRAATQEATVPVLTHELGQWDAYPDFSIIPKFTGYMRPGNYEIFRDSLAAHGLLAKDKQFAYASGRYQLECYKEEIEANLRTPGLAGFQLLDLHDYVGQGTALVGLLDTFWDSKSYVGPAEFREFCSDTVPLARLTRRVFTTADRLDVPVEIAHAGPAPLPNAVGVWQIVGKTGAVVAGGQWPAQTIPLGKNIPLGQITADLSKLPAPQAYKLVVSLRGTTVKNEWNFWLYPAQAAAPVPTGVTITHSWDEAQTRLAAGGKVLFLPRQADLDWTSPPLDTVPIFWDRQMGPKWSRMLGVLCDATHPALAAFPTDVNYDWQWADVIAPPRLPVARAINLDGLPRALQPIVEPIDDWNRNYKLGLIFECRVGTGRLMVCAADLESALDTRPAARQLRRSLLAYMAGPRFQPKTTLSAAEVGSLLFDTRVMSKLGASITADGQPANGLIDGDPNTSWQSAPGAAYPHTLAVTFPAPVAASGLVVMPRQTEMHHLGDIREYTIQASNDGAAWRDVTRGEMPSTFEPVRIRFPQTFTARYLRLNALSGYPAWNAKTQTASPDTTAALADLAVIYDGPALPDDGTGAPAASQSVHTATPEIDEGPAAPAPRPVPPGR